jgi:hypothetical protein
LTGASVGSFVGLVPSEHSSGASAARQQRPGPAHRPPALRCEPDFRLALLLDRMDELGVRPTPPDANNPHSPASLVDLPRPLATRRRAFAMTPGQTGREFP